MTALRWGCFVVASLLATVGCARSAFEQQVRAGQWQVAANTFRSDSLLLRKSEAVRRAARIHAMPDSTTWDPVRALELLRASRVYMSADKVPEGDLRLEQLLQLIVQERHANRSSREALEDSVRRFAGANEELRLENERLRLAGTATDSARVLLQRLVARLEADLRDREMQLATLRSELERLKAIDLSRPSRPTSVTELQRDRGAAPPGR
jgi:hypothetical protein